MADSEQDQKHRQRMQRKKAVVDRGIARATDDRGVLLVHTGNGKGKSSSAFGMLARALGHNMRAGVVQFIKGSDATGEECFFRQFPAVSYHVMGEGFSWETQDIQRDRKAAQAAWQQASEMLKDKTFNFILLDELNITLKNKLLNIDRVIEDLQNRPRMQHVVITGRGSMEELLNIADTVTEMKMLKHAFQAGVRAQKGVEY